MKKVSLILGCFLILGTIAHAQNQNEAIGQLVCDPKSGFNDTLTATHIIYVDSVTNKILVTKGKAIRQWCHLMYQGVNGAPNAPTQQTGVKQVLYFDSKGKVIPEKFVIRFITK